jgi:hypothetical protein
MACPQNSRRMSSACIREPRATDTEAFSVTPLQNLHGIITPTGLVFERHHAGVPEIAPSEHRLLVQLRRRSNAGIACWIKLEITPASFSNHSRYGTGPCPFQSRNPVRCVTPVRHEIAGRTVYRGLVGETSRACAYAGVGCSPGAPTVSGDPPALAGAAFRDCEHSLDQREAESDR